MSGEQPPKSFTNEQSSYLSRTIKNIDVRLNQVIAKLAEFMAAGAVLTANLANGSVTQVKLGTNVAGNGPLFSAHHTVANALAFNTYTKVIYNVEDFDTNNNYDPVTGVFTPTVPGWYLINAAMQGDGTNAVHLLSIWKNGAIFCYGKYENLGEVTGIYTVTGLVNMNGSTDNLEIRMYSNPAANTLTANGGQLLFQGCLIRTL
jgi:hypothetical protein